MTLMYYFLLFYYSKVISTVFQEVYRIVHTSEYTVQYIVPKMHTFLYRSVHRHLPGDQLMVKYM